MATEKNVWLHTRSAAADLSSYQYHAVYLNSSDQIALCSTQGQVSIGLLQNEPTSGQNADVAFAGIAKGLLGGTVTYMDPLCTDTSGHLIKANDNDENVIGRALKSGVATAIIPVMVIPSVGLSAGVTPSQETYTAHANYASTGQYLAVKAHTDDGEVILCAAAGEAILGILQNAPASGAEAEVCTYGECTAKAGGTVTAGDRLAIDASGQVVTASGNAQVIGWAVADIASGATGTIFVAPVGMYSVDGSTLADGKIWIGSSGNAAVACTPSGHVSMTNAGAFSVTNVATTSSGDAAGDLIYRDASTTFERLAKGTAAQILAMNGAATAPEWIAQSAITAGNATTAATATNVATTSSGDAAGDLIYRDAAATLERLAKGTAGQILAMNTGASAPEWVSMSSDATMAAGGAVTIGAKKVAVSKLYSAAQGCIFRTDATNAVSELSLADGKIAVGDGTDVVALSAKTSGQILVGNGTTLASVAVAGDATLVAAGTLTLDKEFIRTSVTDITAANVKTLNATPVVLVDHSALVGAGTIAAGDALIFHGAVVNLYGGAAAYDQAENMTVVYQTAGGGATVSLTLANFCNGGVDGKLSTLKPIATDVAPDADEDLVIKCSASPYNAQGDRNMRVVCYYSVMTPHA